MNILLIVLALNGIILSCKTNVYDYSHGKTRYGRSIGSGPTTYLASHPDYPVSGVILHSPIASGFRILDFDVNLQVNFEIFINNIVSKNRQN